MTRTNMSSDPQPLGTDPVARAAGLAKLQLLEGYLRDDPGNTHLLVDTFDAALRCAEWGQAAFHLRHGQALAPQDVGWALREADFWLAQSEFDRARDVLEPVAVLSDQPSAFAGVVLHNLAYIDFQQHHYAACVARMAVRLEATPSTQVKNEPISPELQHLWLRALHRTGELQRAIRWTRAQAALGRLSAQAAGIASLIALDCGDVTAAQNWSATAIRDAGVFGKPIEALVTQASLALAGRDGPRAQALAASALQINPDDGRAWSAHAFADLLLGQMEMARAHFSKALATLPQHIGTWHGQGWTQLLLRDLDAAQLSFEAALALDRNFAESHGGLAVVLALKKRADEAQNHVLLAMKLDKSNLSGRYAQAILSGEVQETEAFKRLAQRLLGDRVAPLGGSLLDAVTRSAIEISYPSSGKS